MSPSSAGAQAVGCGALLSASRTALYKSLNLCLQTASTFSVNGTIIVMSHNLLPAEKPWVRVG